MITWLLHRGEDGGDVLQLLLGLLDLDGGVAGLVDGLVGLGQGLDKNGTKSCRVQSTNN